MSLHYDSVQVVWAESSKLGCGAHLCLDGFIIVCNYATG